MFCILDMFYLKTKHHLGLLPEDSRIIGVHIIVEQVIGLAMVDKSALHSSTSGLLSQAKIKQTMNADAACMTSFRLL